MNKKDKVISFGYFIGVVLITLVLIYQAAFIRNDIVNKRSNMGCVQIEDYEYKYVKDDVSPTGYHNEYIFTLDEKPTGNDSIDFMSVHQSVKVYIEDELVYSLGVSKKNLFGKTPGHNHNTLSLRPEDFGKRIKIIITNVYKKADSDELKIYFGSKETIIMQRIFQALPVFILGFTAIVIGFGFIVYVFLTRKENMSARSLFEMGLFAITLGVWKISDMNVMFILFPANVVVATVPLVSLMLACITFTMYAKELFRDSKKNIWYVPCIIAIVIVYTSVIMQVLGIADFREFLTAVHLDMCLIVIISVVMIIREIIKYGINRKLKITIMCLALCMFGLIADMFSYYRSDGMRNTVFGMTGFLVYIIVLGVISIRGARKLIVKGKKALVYEEMAFTDQLTGLYNRTAYAQETMDGDKSIEGKILVMFDLNNLKVCNDNYGHDVGDEYIVVCAQIIKNNFGENGKCFRTGGDEFIAILENCSEDRCSLRAEKMEKEIEELNKSKRFPFEAGIAYGYVTYDSGEDENVMSAMRRADKKMYEKKFRMKQNTV